MADPIRLPPLWNEVNFASNIYQNHCVPENGATEVPQCFECLDQVPVGGYSQPTPGFLAENAGLYYPKHDPCGTRYEHDIQDSQIAEISTDKYYYSYDGVQEPKDRRTRSEGVTESQIEPFFETVSMRGASSAEGYFEFEDTVARASFMSKVNAADILGSSYVESGAVYVMNWFNFEMEFDSFGELDNQFKVEISLCGQHEASEGGDSTYGTIAHEASTGSGAAGSRARLHLTTATDSFSRSTEGDGSWSTLWGGPYFSNKVNPIVDPRKSVTPGNPHRPVMLFGRRNQVWKIKVTGDTHADDTNTDNYWKFKMYLTDKNGVRQ